MKVDLVNTWQQKAAHALIAGSAVQAKTYSTQGCYKLIGLNTSSYYAIQARQVLPVMGYSRQMGLIFN